MKAFVTIIIILSSNFLQAQVNIENLDYFELENSIIITYDLIGKGNYSIELYFTKNKGVTWYGPLDNITGNMYGVTPGRGRYLIYNIADDRYGLIGENIKFKIKLLPDKGYFIDQRDGRKYKWVRIGEQIWMGENLKALVYPDRTPIKIVKSGLIWGKLKEDQEACCWYENIKNNADQHGILYTWAAATGYQNSTWNSEVIQGVCPDGWHVPSSKEWSQLDDFIYNDKGSIKTGKYLRFSGWYANNAYSFSAKNGGYRDAYGNYMEKGYSVYWWTTSASHWSNDDFNCSGYGCADYRGIIVDDDTFLSMQNYMNSGFYVRCIKD